MRSILVALMLLVSSLAFAGKTQSPYTDFLFPNPGTRPFGLNFPSHPSDMGEFNFDFNDVAITFECGYLAGGALFNLPVTLQNGYSKAQLITAVGSGNYESHLDYSAGSGVDGVLQIKDPANHVIMATAVISKALY